MTNEQRAAEICNVREFSDSIIAYCLLMSRALPNVWDDENLSSADRINVTLISKLIVDIKNTAKLLGLEAQGAGKE